MNKLILVSGLFLSTCAVPVMAQSNCASHEKAVSHLSESYGETQQSVGLGGDNTMLEMYANEATGSWSVLVTGASGLTCLVASGTAYERVSEHVEPQGEDM